MNGVAIALPVSARPNLRIALLQRTIGSLLLAMMILTRLAATHHVTPTTVLVLAFNVLVWPQIVYRLGRRTRGAFGAERHALVVDAFVAGAWAAWMEFPALPAVAFYVTTVISSLLGLGKRAGGKALGAGALGAGLVAAVHGPHVNPSADAATDMLAIATVLAYVTLLASVSHQKSQALREASRQAERERARQERFAAGLARYLPPQVIAALADGTATNPLGSRRCFLTVFFSDIEEFTPMVQGTPPEDLTLFLNAYIYEMSAIAARYGGTADRYIGDALLVFFGAPHSSGADADAVACVQMAAEMQRRLRELRPAWEQRFHLRVNVRMGIDSGFCTVGNYGAEQHLQYTAIGLPVNIASRLQAAAEPGGVLLSAASQARVRTQVACVPRGPRVLKGVDAPVVVYALPPDLLGDAAPKTREREEAVGEPVG